MTIFHRFLRVMSVIALFVLCAIPSYAVDYLLPPKDTRLIGENEFYEVKDNKETLESIAAHFQLGLTNLLEANPGIDPFLPKPGSRLLIPHQLILPDAPRKGIVVNLAEMRLYYYPKGQNIVRVLPIGIGEIGKGTPENWVTRVYRKKANPTWTPTKKIREEYALDGTILPDVWPAGADNPMGLFALYIGNLYAIHGTNANFGIGLRISHGCVRLRNPDIENLFKTVPVGTRVQFINRPIKATLEPDGNRYLEVHQPLSKTEQEFDSEDPLPLDISNNIEKVIQHQDTNKFALQRALESRNGTPTRINAGI